jgi:hypothetical protein
MKNKPEWIIEMEKIATETLAEVLQEIEEEDDSDIYTIKGEGNDEYNTSNNK